MLAARESQCTVFSAKCDVAGTVNSKSSATNVPASVGEENVPAAVPLKLALPSTRNGRFVGPPRAFTKGRHSSRSEVEMEKRSRDVAANVPWATTFDSGVVRLNCASSNESLAPEYLPWKCAVNGNSREAGRAGGFTSKVN